jgi:hypothetical protein
LKGTDISEVRPASIIRAMMEAVHTSETSVHFNVTIWRYNPEDYKPNMTWFVSLRLNESQIEIFDLKNLL